MVLTKLYSFLFIHSHAFTKAQFCILYTSTVPTHAWELVHVKISNVMWHISCDMFLVVRQCTKFQTST